jgi:signal peptidase I
MNNQTTTKAAPPRKDRAAEIANTFEWLITAFILAFVFRAFVMEAFRIPTGSMADTLMGAHFRVGCPQCGYRYAHGFVPQRFQLPQDTMPGHRVPLPLVRCPSCGYLMRDSSSSPLELPVDNGDRILVLKCLYQFTEPRRWDVIVFKNPINPAENYIKRLIGLPGENIEIVDGDIFIDGRIARKPPKVQRELWMPIYSHNYQPVSPEQEAFNGQPWENPLQDPRGAWQQSPDDPTRMVLDSASPQLQVLTYGADSANNSHASYAYNDAILAARMPVASDLMVRFYAQSSAATGPIGAAIEKYGVVYQGLVDPQGRMAIFQIDAQGNRQTLAEQRRPAAAPGVPATRLQFAVVDRRVELRFGEATLSADLSPERNGLDMRDLPPHTRILGAGQWNLSHIALFRDIHYTSRISHARRGRATEGRPFQLKADEFFVLGDNSPNSEDGRWWHLPPMASRGHTPPRAGVVPRDYLVGKAMFVYWPSGYTFPWPRFIRDAVEQHGQRNGLMRIVKTLVQLRWIPNIGKMRFIYGGAGGSSAPAGIAGTEPSQPG